MAYLRKKNLFVLFLFLFSFLLLFPNDIHCPTKFLDISERDWYFDEVNKLADMNLINGVSETKFSPETRATQAMIIKMLHNLFCIQNNISCDSKKSNLADDFIESLKSKLIDPIFSFEPNAYIR